MRRLIISVLSIFLASSSIVGSAAAESLLSTLNPSNCDTIVDKGDGTLVEIPRSNLTSPKNQVEGVCYIRTQIVGYDNCIITHEITSAKCEPNWDGFCSPRECRGRIGDIYTEVDPLCILGG